MELIQELSVAAEIKRVLLEVLAESPSGSVGSASDSYSVGPWIEAQLV